MAGAAKGSGASNSQLAINVCQYARVCALGLDDSSQTRYINDKDRQKEITYTVTCFIASNMLLKTTIEKLQFLTTLDPRYEVPDCKHFSTTALPDLYNE